MKNLILIFGIIAILFSGCGVVTDSEPAISAAPDASLSASEPAESAKPDILSEPVPIEGVQENKPLDGKIICIDAGHGIFKAGKKEPVAPGAAETKAAFVSGTAGSQYTEEQINLMAAKTLEEILCNYGATVIMTRTESECDMSNSDRARLANENHADIMVRLHADGSSNPNIHGISVLTPGDKYISDTNLLSSSRAAAEAVLDETIKATGAKNNGISVRNDLTGFNWSEVPVILVEMGFMTNAAEDKLLSDSEYRSKITNGIANGLIKYFSENANSN